MLDHPAVADYADGNALDGERLAARIDQDRFELRILRQQFDDRAAPAQPLTSP